MTDVEYPKVENESLVVAIDGPSGSGKSSTARGVAQRLGLAYLDTGAMYRAVTVAYLRSGLRPDQSDDIAALVDQVELTVTDDPDAPAIEVDGEDVSAAIREPRVSQHVSVIATHPHVREVLTDQMRALIEAADHRIVVEGRDITTVVWPRLSCVCCWSLTPRLASIAVRPSWPARPPPRRSPTRSCAVTVTIPP